MRRMILVTAAGLLLVGAGVAVAHGFNSRAVKEVSATFEAKTVSNHATVTCTGVAPATDLDTYVKSRGTYTGAVTSTDPALAGTATIVASSLVNTTKQVGTVSGEIRIVATAGGGETSARFDGVLKGAGTPPVYTFAGLAVGGNRHGYDDAAVKLLANLSAVYDFTSAGGFTGGKIGGGTAPGAAVLLTSGGCTTAKPAKPEKIKARGVVTAVLPVSPAPPAAPIPPTSLTVAGITCTVPTNLQAAVAALKVNVDVVSMECEVANNTNTLTGLSGQGHERGDKQGNRHGNKHGVRHGHRYGHR